MLHSFLESVEAKMGNNNPFIEKLFQFTGLKELFCIDIQINIYILGYRTFRVGFNADGASVYRASLAFIFFEKIYKGGQNVLVKSLETLANTGEIGFYFCRQNFSRLSLIQTTWNQLSTDVCRSPFLYRKEQFDVLICTCS